MSKIIDYINFNKCIDIGNYSCDNQFPFKSSKCKYYVDDEILEMKMNKRNAIENMFNDAKQKSFDDYDEEIIFTDNKINVTKKLMYKSDDNKYILFFISYSCQNHYVNTDMLGLINIDKKEYVFVGTSCSHPFVVSNSFEFGNSDGSGPYIFGKYDKESAQKCYDSDAEENEKEDYENNHIRVMKYLVKYFTAFMDDEYH